MIIVEITMDSDVWDLFFQFVVVGVLIALAAALVSGIMIGGCVANV